MADAMILHAEELTGLDQAIGDGDHGLNMKRGCEALLADLDPIAAMTLPKALIAVGTTLVLKVGGASGPLYGTLFMELGKALPERATLADLVSAAEAALAAVKRRGKSDVGCKTMLDVLEPALLTLCASIGGDVTRVIRQLPAVAQEAAEATRPMRAVRGRASFLGERSIGHIDPGARSAALLITAACEVLEKME